MPAAFEWLVVKKGTAMSQQDTAHIREIGELFFVCLYNIQRTSKEDWQGLDLTMAQLKVCITLSFEGPLSISKLADGLGISHPTASHLVERLVRAGFVERVEHFTDRRYTLARLTSQGQTMFQRLRQGRLDDLQYWLIQLDEQDFAALRQGLEALNRIVQSSFCSQET
jgi:DNA-binding MarR family transcriptional regulator